MTGEPAVAHPWVAIPVALVCLLTVLGGMYGLRLSRTTSDFYVAGRAVGPGRNASAIGGEYLSAVSFLGVAGLAYAGGVDALWYPVGYTLGYLVLLVLIAAPLRRSGAYTASDFAQARLESRSVRRLATTLTVLIGWGYLLLQLHGAGLALHALTGAPSWLGGLVVTGVVTVNVVAGGMRSVTLVQAVHYWFKVVAISLPACLLLFWWWHSGGPVPTPVESVSPVDVERRLYGILSTILALGLGTMGLPHVVVRFYTNPDGRAARRTTVIVIGLLALFYVFPPVYAVLGRAYLPALPPGTSPDMITLLLPSAVLPQDLAAPLTGLLAAGAFTALLSTASGLAISVAGVLDQDVVRPALDRFTGGDAGGVQSFRAATLVATLVPCAVAPFASTLPLATSVTVLFTVVASTFSPLLVLGVWWRGLSVPGGLAGMLGGAVLSVGAPALLASGLVPPGWARDLLAAPALWCVPAAFALAILVSLATPRHVPASALATLIRLHTPESVDLRHGYR